MIHHEECPFCGWEGTVQVVNGRALCPECEWYFWIPDREWDLHELAVGETG